MNVRFLIVAISLLLASVVAKAQLSGGFITHTDGHIYFTLSNTSVINQTFSWQMINDITGEVNGNTAIIPPGQTYFYGPQTTSWFWARGERFVVVLANGQSGQWVCPYTDAGTNAYGPVTGTYSGRPAWQIQDDLRRARERLADMQRYSSECGSAVLQMQYARMIAEEENRIRQLEQELMRAPR